MTWMIGLVCLLIGTAMGALLFKVFRSDEARVKDLELQLQSLSDEHETYKSNVHTHFSNSARLLTEMTDSYRNIYMHMASGAQNLCPDYISNQLTLSNDAKALLNKEASAASTDGGETPAPPLDYVARMDPEQKGRLSEGYGIDKPDDY